MKKAYIEAEMDISYFLENDIVCESVGSSELDPNNFNYEEEIEEFE